MMGVAAQHSQVPAGPLAPSAVAEVLELMGLVEVRPAEEATEQDLRGESLLDPSWVPPWCQNAAGLPGAPALHHLHQQLQLLILQLLEEGMRR